MKRCVEDLAICGGSQAFLRPLSVGRPGRLDRQRLFERLDWVLDNKWYTNGGPLASELETRLAEMAGVRHCVACCNGTVGLQLLAKAANLTGEVIMPSMTFAATAHAMSWIGLEPVFCDINSETGCLDVGAVEAAINERTSAILGVHLWGATCSVNELQDVAKSRGLRLFFDAAHAIGCTYRGRPVGSLGDAEVFSFHATKVVNAFEGGAIATDDGELAERIRCLQNFGIGLGETNEVGGTNGKMSEASAAIGLTSLEAFPRAIARNRENYQSYRMHLSNLRGARIVSFDEEEKQNYQYVILDMDEGQTGISRTLLAEVLQAEQVHAKPYFSPTCHQLKPYCDRGLYSLPHTERLSKRVLALPSGTETTAEDVRRVCNIIQVALRNGRAVTEWSNNRSQRSA